MASSDPDPCSHLATYKHLHGGLLQPNTSPLRSPIHRCDSCSRTAGRLYRCLLCPSVSCPDHAAAHPRSVPGHDIAVDVQRSELFCCVCSDQVYDHPTLNSIRGAGAPNIIGNSRRRRGRKRKSIAITSHPVGGSSSHPWGLRGFNNLGSTCFMNSVLQALMHTPPLRNYFLGDRHGREDCRQKRWRRRGAAVGGEMQCMCCDVDGVFSAVFSGDRTPYSPARFLYSWWKHSSNLASYEQQDAHEFFISILDRIHEREQSSFKDKGIGDCHCIAHSVFSGVLRSDVTCSICGFTSSTYDPCVDISLDLETSNATTKKSGKSSKMNDNSRVSTLMGSLDFFTRPEKLGSDQKFYCQYCQVSQDSVKQMSIRRLPLVLCFHIKRFEHSWIRRASRKINQYLQFPFSLDMTPYLSSSVVRSRFGNRIFAFEGDESDMSSKSSSEFEVFAVVTHTGQLESGHYVTYLCLRNQWYKCDDAWITQVSEEVVRASQVYLIYYMQKGIYYRAGEDASCLPVSPQEWNRSPREPFFRSPGCC